MRSQYGRCVIEGLFTPLQAELVHAHAPGEHNLSALKTRAYADRVKLHAAVCNRSCVQLLSDAEGQKRQSVKRVITDFGKVC